MIIIRYLQLCYLIARVLRGGYMPPRKPTGDLRNYARSIAVSYFLSKYYASWHKKEKP